MTINKKNTVPTKKTDKKAVPTVRLLQGGAGEPLKKSVKVRACTFNRAKQACDALRDRWGISVTLRALTGYLIKVGADRLGDVEVSGVAFQPSKDGGLVSVSYVIDSATHDALEDFVSAQDSASKAELADMLIQDGLDAVLSSKSRSQVLTLLNGMRQTVPSHWPVPLQS